MGEQTYAQLRCMAAAGMRDHRALFQPTALVHEAWMKIARHRPEEFRDRDHFRSLAARAMRQLLIDQARARSAHKRGGDPVQVTLSGIGAAGADEVVDVLSVDAALRALAEVDPRRAQVVELRFFGGLTVPEIAEATGASVATVERDWRAARAWLRVHLEGA